MIYDFLKVSDEVLDVRAPVLAGLLSKSGRKMSVGDALALILKLERYVLRKVNDEAPDLRLEFDSASWIPEPRAPDVLHLAVGWPIARAPELLVALEDPDVAVLEPLSGGWRVRGVADRYMRFAQERRASRHRTRDNAKARAAGWEPGDGKAWVHKATGAKAASLAEAIVVIDRGVP